MSVLHSLHVASLHRFLAQIKKNRDVWISEAGCDSRILNRVRLNGTEERSFTESEIKKILVDYKGLKHFFESKELWPKELE